MIAVSRPEHDVKRLQAAAAFVPELPPHVTVRLLYEAFSTADFFGDGTVLTFFTTVFEPLPHVTVRLLHEAYSTADFFGDGTVLTSGFIEDGTNMTFLPVGFCAGVTGALHDGALMCGFWLGRTVTGSALNTMYEARACGLIFLHTVSAVSRGCSCVLAILLATWLAAVPGGV